MSWNFRTRLMLAFLLFGLVPILILALVTLDATNQLKDRAARVVHRGAFFNTGTGALTGSPASVYVGTTNNVVISVTDGRGTPVSLPPFNLTVFPAPAVLASIEITPANPSVAVGKTLQFKATGTYAGGLTQDLTKSVNLTWTSSNRAFATIINVPKKSKGLATGVSPGTVTIRASDRKGVIFGTTTLTVI